ncbi:precorrin-4 C(11)-methyltransferase [Paludifilum halophilum]|uniref:Precorrin-4 C(11)-methyltransferase n=1 Tax=Paludifilum halophilum TaxID=1642702 RepID=A0A235BAA3_9BACL|nr:precorrin-4 C(11)-methyltransferase [Paludifilum halophilum]
MERGTVYLIGAGPGDAELITLRGSRILRQADWILYASSLVSEELFEEVKPEARLLSSAEMHLDEIVTAMVEQARKGRVVARVHSGDPSIYGAILEQVVRLRREGIPFEIIPGVSAAFAAAARIGSELTVPEISQTVVFTRTGGRASPLPPGGELRKWARDSATLALFLSAALVDRVVAELREAGMAEDTPVVIAEKVTWPEEQVIHTTLAELSREMRAAKITRQAMILVGRALDPSLLESGEHRSRLYDPGHTHLFRKRVKSP